MTVTFGIWPTGQPTKCAPLYVCVHVSKLCLRVWLQQEWREQLQTLHCSHCFFFSQSVCNHQSLPASGPSEAETALKFICQVDMCQQFDRPSIPPSCPSFSRFPRHSSYFANPTWLLPLFVIPFSCPFPLRLLASATFIFHLSHPTSPLFPLSGGELLSFLIKSEDGL